MEQHLEELPVLIAQTGPLDGQRWTIQDTLVLGRDPSCDIVITTPDKQVSRRHAQLKLKDDGVWFKDL